MIRSRLLLRCIATAASIAMLSAASQAQQKTARACEDEWRANKASIQGSGKTKKAFMIECRAGTGQPAAARQAQPAPDRSSAIQAAPGGAPQTAPSRPRQAAREPARGTGRGAAVSAVAGEFATESEAKAHCPGETVVWANTRSKVYHFPSSRSYGNTKRGAYMCEKDTAAAGIRSAKNEKRPR
jgi:hypothetical protein